MEQLRIKAIESELREQPQDEELRQTSIFPEINPSTEFKANHFDENHRKLCTQCRQNNFLKHQQSGEFIAEEARSPIRALDYNNK